MIHFVCICGEPFDVPAELAGESLQCPACRRLVDVPLLGQAGSFEDDGTVRLQDADVAPGDLAEKMRVFAHGDDLRGAYGDIALAGDPADNADGLVPAPPPARRGAPRYDPITGELVLPVEIAGDDFAPAPPAVVPGGPVLGYARNNVAGGPVTAQPHEKIAWWSAPWRIVSGTNLVAVAVVLVLHLLIVVGFSIPGFNVFFAIPAIGILLAVVAHYVNTLEDIGPNFKDRVPVLLRSVSMGEDVGGPLLMVLASGLFSFGPLLLVLLFSPTKFLYRHEWVLYAGLAWGFLVFPLVAFTLACGGVLANLTPGRLVSVLAAAPVRCVMATGTFWLACFVYAVAFSTIRFPDLMAVATPGSMTLDDFVRYMSRLSVSLGVFALAVYLMHLTAFWFGLIYRDKNEKFTWVLQRHERRYGQEQVTRIMNGRRPVHTPPQVGRNRMNAIGGPVPPPAPLPQPVLPMEPPPGHGFEVKFPQ